MLATRLFCAAVLLLGGTTAFAAAANDGQRGAAIDVHTAPARMILTARPPEGPIGRPAGDAGLVTIFSNLAGKYPKGEYWCCEGYNVMGSAQGEQWMAAEFTPAADHVVTRIEVAAGWSQGTNGLVISLDSDSNGVPGNALKTWKVGNLQNFGTCCALVEISDRSGIPVSAGKQYWIVLSTGDKETDTVDGWNVDDTDQIDSATLASYTSNQWTVFQASPGVAFAVKGSS